MNIDDDINDDGTVVLTAAEVLLMGLKEVNFTEKRINRVKGEATSSTTNFKRFRDHFGVSHVVVAALWETLQESNIPTARWDVTEKGEIEGLFEALHFLKAYKTESNCESTFDKNPKTLRANCWSILCKIQALKEEVIVFPDDLANSTDVWIMTVDGINFEINEPTIRAVTKDRKMFDHKSNHAGLSYEVGLDLFRSKVIWINGPFETGASNDAGRFSQHGLKDKLKSIKKKCLADKIYSGHDETVTYNAWDQEDVMEVKARAQMRHEQFNGMLTDFNCLVHRFQHPSPPPFLKHKICFEAVAVLCQYRMDYGEPLFDILAGVELLPDPPGEQQQE